MRPTYTRTLQAGFGLSLFILIATSVASYISIKNLVNSSEEVNRTNTILQKLESVISLAKDAETGQRGYLLSGDTLFLEPYRGSYVNTMAALDTVQSLTKDNPTQQADVKELRTQIADRFTIMDRSINSKLVEVNQLVKGKVIMDSMRALVEKMENREQGLLRQRTESQNRFSAFTPVLIIIAGMIALFSTIFFYRKVNSNFKEKQILTDQLQEKDREISNRIDIIRSIADKIAKGEYKIRLNDAQSDGLGNLSGSLNRMAASLDHSFSLLSDKEWIQTGLATINDHMVGDKSISTLTQGVIDELANYSNSQVGAFYLLEDDSTLVLRNGHALMRNGRESSIKLGSTVVGQVAQTNKEILLTDISNDDFLISFATGDLRPRNIMVFPVTFEGQVRGVIELGTLGNYTERDLQFFRLIRENIGIAVNTAISRTRLQELLEETQAQSEELQAQHTELEALNVELEMQAEKLQASEEELKVQQEELTETNQELQERSRLLEEKNQLIIQRNSEIQQQAEELAQSTRYKSEFLANMSHELRTPLNSVLLLSRLLAENRQQNLTGEQVESANVIQSSGKSLLLLIDDIMDLSKIESGKMEVEYHSIELIEILNEVRSLFEPLTYEKKIDFQIRMAPGTPTTIETDKQRLGQILKNLLSNAIKFTSKGSVELDVAASATTPGFVSFSVRDTGIGIAPEKQRIIFEAFQQADGSTSRQYGGTGLGLSISRQLAILLRGDISLVSQPGTGSTFTLSIPMSKDTPSVVETITERVEKPIDIRANGKKTNEYIASHIPADVPDDRQNIVPGDKVMLIIEDDTAFANILLDFTRKKGYKGVVAVRGDQGIEMAITYIPVGILLDIQLPVKSGWEVIEELKKNKLTRHIPVHIMSSFQVKRESLVSGAVDFIEKPLAAEQMDTIFSRIEFYLKKASKKVLIIEDNSKHAQALSYFLGTNKILSVISETIESGLSSLQKKEVDCVILDMGVPDDKAYETLELMKIEKGLADIPVIIFTGKSLSRSEEMRIKKYADAIVVKTAHSYRRILDEVSLFLHLVEENKKDNGVPPARLKPLNEVLRNKTVMVADDDVRNIFSLTRVLEQHQLKVVPAMNGKEALEALKQNGQIDIILMDMMMPELDGYETISKIRESKRWKNLPIIAVTAKAMTGDREKCIEAGASDYISKPVDFDQLISLLRIWLYDSVSKKEN